MSVIEKHWPRCLPEASIQPDAGQTDQRPTRNFDPWRTAKSPAAKELVRTVLGQFLRYEQHRSPRQRARRKRDQEVLESTIEAIVCDLALAHIWADDGVLLSRSNRVLGRKSRYRPACANKTLPVILDKLASPELEFVVQELGHLNPFLGNQLTLVKPGRRLTSRIEELSLEEGDFGYCAERECIILKRPKEGHFDQGEWIEYDDTAETLGMRSAVRNLNSFLETADIDCHPWALPDHLSTRQRWLYRVFTRGSFQSGGRLFGGFWQEMTKADRREGLTIEDEETVELDYGQMAPRLLYALVGATPPSDDAYLISGHHPAIFRNGFKKLFNALLFADRPLSRKPQGTAKLLPNAPIGRLVDALQREHPAIAHCFHTGIGHHLQFLESELLVELLTRCNDIGLVALPIHDAIIVKRSRADEAQALMEDVFRARTGLGAIVHRY
ncbi:hypothetical protein L0V05_07855 [Tabrizicola sp. J26]|uniref:hypothetical protein n=1 Tax=Alitabrizicola rongguiensis TaxID=2909234 RepID=UPI001F25621D|nr:hypothetical protein [Tabrizicola rongguiensis]MCF1708726.1 hypothetical protein [Tabrizicola rongguiensis]